jgi:hypothetical protein
MQCPLCLQECETNGVYDFTSEGVWRYYCPTRVEAKVPLYNTSHYTQYHDDNGQIKEFIIILPYQLVNRYHAISPYSVISVLTENPEFYNDMMETSEWKFKEILRLPLLRSDIEEKLLERIKLMILLS